jgi:hypothetical protein
MFRLNLFKRFTSEKRGIGDQRLVQFCFTEVHTSCSFTEHKRVQSEAVLLIESISKDAVCRVVLRELFLVQEQTVRIVKKSIEVGLEQVRLELVTHRAVRILIEFVHLFC